MQRKTWLSLLIIALLAGGLATACKKDKPVTPQDEAPGVDEPVTEVEDDTLPEVVDETPSPLAGGLIEAQNYAESEGLLGDVYFDFDRSNLTSSARDRLAQNAEFMNSNPEFTFTVEGHCDERGTNEYNLALGDRRSNAAMSFLVSLGVDASRLTGISYGEEQPQCTTSGEGCWSQNRRAHFQISGRR